MKSTKLLLFTLLAILLAGGEVESAKKGKAKASSSSSKPLGQSDPNTNSPTRYPATLGGTDSKRIAKLNGEPFGIAPKRLSLYSENIGGDLAGTSNSQRKRYRSPIKKADFGKKYPPSNPIYTSDYSGKTGIRIDNQGDLSRDTDISNTQVQLNGVNRLGGASTSLTKVVLPMRIRQSRPTLLNKAHQHSLNTQTGVLGRVTSPGGPGSSPSASDWSPANSQ